MIGFKQFSNELLTTYLEYSESVISCKLYIDIYTGTFGDVSSDTTVYLCRTDNSLSVDDIIHAYGKYAMACKP